MKGRGEEREGGWEGYEREKKERHKERLSTEIRASES